MAAGCIFLAKNTGRILLAHRSNQVDFGNTWAGWGGKIDAGETPKHTVEREVEEETGFSGDYKINHLWTFTDPDSGFEYYNYLVVVPFEFTPRLNWENDGSKWIEYGEWPHPLHFGIEALLKHSGNTIEKVIGLIKKRKDKIKEVDSTPPPAINQQSSEFSADLIKYMKSVENAGRIGYKGGKWYPHESPEGGLPTIAYGHKLKPEEVVKFSKGISEKDAESLLVRDLELAKNIVSNYHDKWKKEYLQKLQITAKRNPDSPQAKFVSNMTIDSPIFKLDRTQVEMLIDYAFNLGKLSGFPNFADAVFRKDWTTAKAEYKRSYKDSAGVKHELGRNKDFYQTYLAKL